MTKHIRQFSIPFLAIFIVGCATLQEGQDPVVVRSEQTTELAMNTFKLINKTEYDSYAAFKAVDAESAGAVRTFVNKVRNNQHAWLESARNLTKAYKNNRTLDNERTLNTALAVLSAAVAEALKYLAQIQEKTAWMSRDLQLVFAGQYQLEKR